MIGSPLYDLTIEQASVLIHTGELSPVDLVDACLERIERLTPTLNAFLTVMADSARHEARYAADAIRRGEDWGPLHGIPIGIKDLIDVAGVRMTAGSDFLRDHVAEADAPVVQELRAAGAIIIGKTHLHEFAIGATNVNPHYGPARNPWNIALSPGGSSGGSAVAVAAGMCPGALGTDTGGSVRLPSALCGLTGLRPTVGQINTQGVVPLSEKLDTVGPIARTAYDVAMLLDALGGNAPIYYREGLNEPVIGLRLGLVADAFFWQETDVDIVRAVRDAAEYLTGMGLRLTEVNLPGVADAVNATGVIILAEAADHHRERLAAAPERFGADVRRRLERGAALTATEYIRALRVEREWRAALYHLLRDEIDILVAPTTPVAAHEIAGSEGISAAKQLLRFTYPFSLSGLPALSVPCGFTREGLPVGMQLVALEAGVLLRVAHAYQQATDWHMQRPAL